MHEKQDARGVWNICLCWKYCQLCTFFWKTHVNHFLIISSEVSILATTYTSYLEVSYVLKIVLYFSTFLYCDLSCELWKIYYAEFHALGWLSECWFTESICRQYIFFAIKISRILPPFAAVRWVYWWVYSWHQSLGQSWICWAFCDFMATFCFSENDQRIQDIEQVI